VEIDSHWDISDADQDYAGTSQCVIKQKGGILYSNSIIAYNVHLYGLGNNGVLLCTIEATQFVYCVNLMNAGFPQNWSSLHLFVDNDNQRPDHNEICTSIFHLNYVCTDKIL
jgi:hypothetical protein